MTRPRPEDEYVFDDPEPGPAYWTPIRSQPRRHRTGLIVALAAGGLLLVALIAGLGVYVVNDNLHRVADLSDDPGQAPIPTGNVSNRAGVSREATDSFTYEGTDYTLDVSASYLNGVGVFQADAQLHASAAGPQRAALLIQEIDFVNNTDGFSAVFTCLTSGNWYANYTTRAVTEFDCSATSGTQIMPTVMYNSGLPTSGLGLQVVVADIEKAGFDHTQAVASAVAHAYVVQLGD